MFLLAFILVNVLNASSTLHASNQCTRVCVCDTVTILCSLLLTAGQINARVREAEVTEIAINTAREVYRVVPIRGSILYFVIADLVRVWHPINCQLQISDLHYNTERLS